MREYQVKVKYKKTYFLLRANDHDYDHVHDQTCLRLPGDDLVSRYVTKNDENYKNN